MLKITYVFLLLLTSCDRLTNQLPAYISAIQSATCLYFRNPISSLLILPPSNQSPAYISAIQSATCLYYCHPISSLLILLPSNQLSVYITAIQSAICLYFRHPIREHFQQLFLSFSEKKSAQKWQSCWFNNNNRTHFKLTRSLVINKYKQLNK